MADAGCDPSKVHDIARQFVENEVPKNLKIVLAGGRDDFRHRDQYDEDGLPGKRHDDRDLIDEWLDDHNVTGTAKYVTDKHGLNSVTNETDYVLGLFNYEHCDYNIDIERNKLQDKVPTLTDMTKAAIEHLQRQSEAGFFLFVEGARIDMAHHDNWAHIALDETKEFARAIETARGLTDEEDTLIVVTADHSHTMTINGYAVSASVIATLHVFHQICALISTDFPPIDAATRQRYPWHCYERHSTRRATVHHSFVCQWHGLRRNI